MKTIRILSLSLVCLLYSSGAAFAQISPDLTGSELRAALRAEYLPQTSLSYREAREQMFGRIDNRDGKVRLVYTGFKYSTRSIPDGRIVNTEHTWPQSKFEGADNRNAIKSDLHHLFPTFNEVNAVRQNNPFGEIPDAETLAWWIDRRPLRHIPDENINDYSESISGLFEPREDHKGNVARAMFYIYTMYENDGIDLAWFRPQIDILMRWHALDPADNVETRRSAAIKAAQGNDNPFVLDASLGYRIFGTEPPVIEPLRNRPPIERTGTTRTLRNDGVRSRDETRVARIACWNLAANTYFNDKPQDDIDRQLKAMLPRVAAAIARMDPAVIGLVEVENAEALDLLAGILATEYNLSYQQAFGPTGRHLNMGVLAKADVVLGDPSLISETSLGSSRLRSSLRVPARVGDFDFEMIVVHLKSGTARTAINGESMTSTKIRERQVARLGRYIRDLRRDGEQDFLVLGDYNMFPSRDQTAFDIFGEDAGLRFITNEELCEPDLTGCQLTHKAGNMLDGIGISTDDTREYRTGTLKVLQPADLFSESGPFSDCRNKRNYWSKVSDHLPLIAEFSTDDLDG